MKFEYFFVTEGIHNCLGMNLFYGVSVILTFFEKYGIFVSATKTAASVRLAGRKPPWPFFIYVHALWPHLDSASRNLTVSTTESWVYFLIRLFFLPIETFAVKNVCADVGYLHHV
jgi:hypothetical protein